MKRDRRERVLVSEAACVFGRGAFAVVPAAVARRRYWYSAVTSKPRLVTE